jgi:ArsR family transcriptional regulator
MSSKKTIKVTNQIETDDQEIFKIHAEFCSILANEKRLRIMWILQEGERSVSDIAETLELSVTNVSQHLKILKNQHAVAERKDGKQVFYRITNPKFIEGCRLIRQGIVENFKLRSEVFLKK